MRFRHILPADITVEDAELLDKARAFSYDEVQMDQLAYLIRERYMDVWKLEGMDAIAVTCFQENAKGRYLELNFFAGRRCSAHRLEIKNALLAIAKETNCKGVVFTSAREGFARVIEAKEVARIYEL